MRLDWRRLKRLGVLGGLSLLCNAAAAGSYEDFFSAIAQDRTAEVQLILQRGFDPGTPSPEGQSGLFLALRDGALRVADLLIARGGAALDARNASDETPLMMAALKNHLAQARQLIAQGTGVNKPGWTALHYAATGGHLEMIRLLLAEHAYIDAESPNRSTPLMMAVLYGSADAVDLLLAEGADPRLRNAQGHSALDLALMRQLEGVAQRIADALAAARP